MNTHTMSLCGFLIGDIALVALGELIEDSGICIGGAGDKFIVLKESFGYPIRY